MSSRSFEYLLVRKARKTLEIAVLPDGRVVVTAPLGASDGSVEEHVMKRSAWIRRQIGYFRDFEPRLTPRHFVLGETCLFLGRHFRLRLRAGPPGVSVDGDFLVVAAGDPSPSNISRAIEAWQRKQATTVFHSLLEKAWARFDHAVERQPTICVKSLVRRWGSLSRNGLLTLNLALIQAPRPCIEYVICHELCHIDHPDHGLAFYAGLEEVLPDWRARKLRLERLLS
jgi:predicted metal-dependent hydrolase